MIFTHPTSSTDAESHEPGNADAAPHGSVPLWANLTSSNYRYIMKYHELSWIIMKYHERSWISMNYDDVPWTIMNYHEFSWSTMKYHEVSWLIMTNDEKSWKIMNYHELSWIIMNDYELSWFFMSYYELLWVIMNYHDISWHIPGKNLSSPSSVAPQKKHPASLSHALQSAAGSGTLPSSTSKALISWHGMFFQISCLCSSASCCSVSCRNFFTRASTEIFSEFQKLLEMGMAQNHQHVTNGHQQLTKTRLRLSGLKFFRPVDAHPSYYVSVCKNM